MTLARAKLGKKLKREREFWSHQKALEMPKAPVRKASRFVLQIHRPKDSGQQWHSKRMKKIPNNTTGASNFTIKAKTQSSVNIYKPKSAWKQSMHSYSKLSLHFWAFWDIISSKIPRKKIVALQMAILLTPSCLIATILFWLSNKRLIFADMIVTAEVITMVISSVIINYFDLMEEKNNSP